MANAVKNIAKYIRKNADSEATPVLRELCTALEAGASFELGRLYQLDNKAFELALDLLEEWRFDRHVFERRLQKYLEQQEES
ncbi:MAG TPA: hypothetical protein PLL19_09780 [Thiobacillaceae bacterium]|nr:hypothetical protein [Thiobacillaceae bacterium]HNF89610.1 hypothetical protein [Thiobacillaceae bacterium]HNH88700.1 hypothetical protein [Thiobacillaceae bacterium]HNI07306.1 hypothetical protein [Thiobacillaceae bacterium]